MELIRYHPDREFGAVEDAPKQIVMAIQRLRRGVAQMSESDASCHNRLFENRCVWVAVAQADLHATG